MRAAVLTEVGKPLELLDLEQEGPKAGEVRVPVKATGVCLSDWHIMHGDWPAPLPLVPGHEAAGIVAEVGPVPGGGELVWRVRGGEPGRHTLQFRVDGETVEKEVVVGAGFQRVSALRKSLGMRVYLA